MSSILDALNKLEEEKKEAARAAAEAVIDPRVAARELVGIGKGAMRARQARLAPWVWGLAGLGAASVLAMMAYLVQASVTPGAPAVDLTSTAPAHEMVAAAVARAPELIPAAELVSSPGPLATIAPRDPAPSAPAPAPVLASEVDEPKPPMAATPAPVTEKAAKLPVVAKADLALKAVAPTHEAGADPAPAVDITAPAEPSPARDPSTAAGPAHADAPATLEVATTKLPELGMADSVKRASAPEEPAATPATQPPPVQIDPLPPSLPIAASQVVEGTPEIDPGPITSITKLPPLKDSDKVRLGFDQVKIHMVQPETKSRPHAKAIINYKPVLIGETIPQTRTTLIGVDIRGIAIQVNGSKERYFVPFGHSLL